MVLRPWFFLLAAVAAEVVGVTAMKIDGPQHSAAGLLFMYAMVGLSFFLLVTAMAQLPMAVTYATWETLGLSAIAVIGYHCFDESMEPMKLWGLAVLIAGAVLVNACGKTAKE